MHLSSYTKFPTNDYFSGESVINSNSDNTAEGEGKDEMYLAVTRHEFCTEFGANLTAVLRTMCAGGWTDIGHKWQNFGQSLSTICQNLSVEPPNLDQPPHLSSVVFRNESCSSVFCDTKLYITMILYKRNHHMN